MSVIVQKVLGATQFDGLTSTTGLFLPTKLGGSDIKSLVRSIKFHTTVALTSWEFREIDPNDPGNTPLLLSGVGGKDINVPGSILLSNTGNDADGSWALRFTTVGKTVDGWLTIEHSPVGLQS